MAQTVKNPPAAWETWVQSLGWEDPPGGEHGNPLQYSCLENPHGQRSLEGYSLGSQRVGQDSATKHSTVSSGMGLQHGTRLEQTLGNSRTHGGFYLFGGSGNHLGGTPTTRDPTGHREFSVFMQPTP